MADVAQKKSNCTAHAGLPVHQDTSNCDQEISFNSGSDISSKALKNVRLLGTYSVNENKMYSHDDSQLKYICPKYLNCDSIDEVEMDLSKAYEKNQMTDYATGERMQNLLRWILDNRCWLVQKCKTPRLSMDFVGERHLFVNILVFPCMGKVRYKCPENFSFFATEFQGTVYLMDCSSDSITQSSPNERRCTYSWAYKFEQYLSGGDSDKGFHANAEHRTALEVQLDKTKLLVDALQNVADGTKVGTKSPEAYFIIKHHNFLDNENIVKFFRDKMLATWARGVLSGSKFLILGYRKKGVVKKIEKLTIEDLPHIHNFQPEPCMKYLRETLDLIKRKVAEKPGVVYKVMRTEDEIHCTEASTTMAAQDVPIVLPNWYTKQVFA